jgi:hypothetical protein
MLETVVTSQGIVSIHATVRRVAVYLDNYSIISLARGPADRRERFVRALEYGADLLFSPTNAAEIIGPEYQSSLAVIKSFLDTIGPHWFPVEGVDIVAVLERESSGADRATACMSSWFVNQFFASRNIQLHGEQRMEAVEPGFFRLASVLDWLNPHRATIRRKLSELDQVLGDRLLRLRHAYEQDRQRFEQVLPEPRYEDSRPATFAFNGLVRCLAIEAKAYRFKKGDGADLCHSVVGAAFGTFATLDKHWKRRVNILPKPNRLARIYYEPELEQLVTDLETTLAN